MNDVENNPMGLDGFEFVEFAALERGYFRARVHHDGFYPCCQSQVQECGVI